VSAGERFAGRRRRGGRYDARMRKPLVRPGAFAALSMVIDVPSSRLG